MNGRSVGAGEVGEDGRRSLPHVVVARVVDERGCPVAEGHLGGVSDIEWIRSVIGRKGFGGMLEDRVTERRFEEICSKLVECIFSRE